MRAKKGPDDFNYHLLRLPDEKLVQRVVAVAHFKNGKTVDETTLKAEIWSLLTGYKLPKQVFFVPNVRRAAIGKADYK